MKLRPVLFFALLSLPALGACFGKDDTGTNPEGDADTDTDADGDTDTDPTGFPADPSPFEVTVSGAYTGTLSFDQPTCYYPEGSSQLRVFWRNEAQAHVFFLLVELLNGFEGEGSYDESMGLRARLQEEAGGSGYYFASDSAAGHQVSMEVFIDEQERIWGEWTATGMNDGAGGSITLEPSTIPIWCPEIN
jgi:hypothetical protein